MQEPKNFATSSTTCPPATHEYERTNTNAGDRPSSYDDVDVFGHETSHGIKYKTMSWELVSMIMIAEIVSNGMLSLPSSLAVVGMVPGLILIIFLGIFATYTSKLLISFKLRHPEVHSMGDAGFVIFGPIGREVMAAGTCLMAVFFCGGQLLAGQLALSSLSDGRLCLMWYTGIFAIATIAIALPRTFEGLGWISIPSVLSIFIAGIVSMTGAGIEPAEPRVVQAAVSSNFYAAFFSITNPVFAYSGHFMFFVLVSEMKRPQTAMRAAYTLQGFATTYYAIFAAVTYGFLGSVVSSPSFLSLPDKWQKASWGIALPNLLIAGSLYSHTAAKVIFVRIFRTSRHLHEHTVLSWTIWAALVFLATGIAFVLAIGVPIFNSLIGINAALFAAWYTYGIAGMFWLHDSYHDGEGTAAWRRKPIRATLAVLTVLAGAFICVAGLYVVIRSIVDAYAQGVVASPFSCRA